ncbi:MAG: RodZ family helix-turn-helix domain-containing protein [Pseudomonadota bacterium]
MSETTEQAQQEEQAEAQQAQQFPGKRLRAAREAAGLSLTDVAVQLRINERMIVALEEDNYDALPAATFASGYLRSYARILGLPEEEFVKPIGGTSEPPNIVSTIGSKEQLNSRDLPVRLVTYLLIGVVLVSVVMWWYTQHGAPELTAAESQNDELMSGQETKPPVQERTGGELLAEDETGDTLVEEEALEVNDVDSVEEVAEVEAAPEEEAANDAAMSQAIATKAPASQPDARETAAEKQRTPSPITASTPISTLEIRYQSDSWTEVSDSAGRQLAYGLIKAGKTLVLKGEAPFRVFVGYAPGVMVYYNGDLFDHSPFQRRDVARFRVGRAEHNLPDSR